MSPENLRDAYRAFTTTCALITTTGPTGPNVMAAEWTYNVSYHPFLLLVAIDPANRTHDMIRETREFGVNLVSEEQIAAMGFAGHYSKADTDKLSSDLFETMPAERIRAPMIRGSLLAAECRLVDEISLGDHTGFLGEVVACSVDPEGKPILLHHGSHRLGERIVREPRLIVAVTPMRGTSPRDLVVSGELTGFERSGQHIAVFLWGTAGDVLAEARAVTDDAGSFRVRIAVPATASAGAHIVEAQSGGLRGLARLEVLP